MTADVEFALQLRSLSALVFIPIVDVVQIFEELII